MAFTAPAEPSFVGTTQLCSWIRYLGIPLDTLYSAHPFTSFAAVDPSETGSISFHQMHSVLGGLLFCIGCSLHPLFPAAPFVVARSPRPRPSALLLLDAPFELDSSSLPRRRSINPWGHYSRLGWQFLLSLAGGLSRSLRHGYCVVGWVLMCPSCFGVSEGERISSPRA